MTAELPVAKRVIAVRALRGGRFDAVAPVLEKVLATHPPAEVEAAAVDSLAAFDEPAAGSNDSEQLALVQPGGAKARSGGDAGAEEPCSCVADGH